VNRITEESWQHNGRHVAPGTELSVRGERGRYRFLAHVYTEAGCEWIDTYGGPPNREAFRSFSLARITTVHAKPKARKP
jgi:hypothetical protein